MWKLYDRLINGIPEDIKVADFLCGSNWTMVCADNGGIGLAMTMRETSREPLIQAELTGLPLKKVAAAAKSWNLLEAGIGVAAINAYYNGAERAIGRGIAHWEWQNRDREVFSVYRKQLKGKKVAVVGHFPALEKKIADICDLSILERNPQPGDYPDPACEYILPEAEHVFITGVTLINKTLPRLLALSQNAHVVLVGPTVVLSEIMFDFGVNDLAGFVVHNAQLCEAGVKRGTRFAVFASGERVSYPKHA